MALLGIAIAISWSIYLVFCKGKAHLVLLSGDQQFQFISFQTCFHSVMEWKAHLLRGFTGSYSAKFLTYRIKKPPDFGLENWRFLHPWETRSLGPQKCSSSHLPSNGHPSAKHFWEKEKAHLMKIQIRSSQLSSHSLRWISRPQPFTMPFKICLPCGVLFSLLVCSPPQPTGQVGNSRRHRSIINL